MPSRSASTAADDKTAAAEETWSYHIARHNQSFLSADCVFSGLFRTIFPDSEVAKKFGSSQDKTAKILTGVLAPNSVRCLLEELGTQPFFISIDASNNREVKLFPFIIRFFTAAHGVQFRLLDMKSLPGEDSQLVATFIASVLQKRP